MIEKKIHPWQGISKKTQEKKTQSFLEKLRQKDPQKAKEEGLKKMSDVPLGPVAPVEHRYKREFGTSFTPSPDVLKYYEMTGQQPKTPEELAQEELARKGIGRDQIGEDVYQQLITAQKTIAERTREEERRQTGMTREQQTQELLGDRPSIQGEEAFNILKSRGLMTPTIDKMPEKKGVEVIGTEIEKIVTPEKYGIARDSEEYNRVIRNAPSRLILGSIGAGTEEGFDVILKGAKEVSDVTGATDMAKKGATQVEKTAKDIYNLAPEEARKVFEEGAKQTFSVIGEGVSVVGDVTGASTAFNKLKNEWNELEDADKYVVSGLFEVATAGLGTGQKQITQRSLQNIQKAMPNLTPKQKTVANSFLEAMDKAGKVSGDAVEGVKNIYTKTSEAIQPTIKRVGEGIEDITKRIDEARKYDIKSIEGVEVKVPKSERIAKELQLKLDELKKSGDFNDPIEVEKIAKEFGIDDLPASATGSDLSARIEGTLAEGLFGRGLKERARTAINKFSSKLDEIEKKGLEKEELGEKISKSFKDAKKAEDDFTRSLYLQARKIAENQNKKINFEGGRTVKFIDDLIDRFKLQAEGGASVKRELDQLEKFKIALSKADQNIDIAEASRQAIGDLANFKKLGDRTTFEKNMGELYNKVRDDIGESISKQVPELAESLSKAKKQFQKVKALEKKDFAKTIKRLSEKEQFDKITERLTSPSISTNEIRELYKAVGNNTAEEIQDTIISNIIKKARGATGDFTEAGFAKQLKNIGDEKLISLLGKEKLDFLKKADTLSQALARATKVARGSQTALVQQLATIPNVIIGAAGGFPALAIRIFGEMGLSKFLNTKLGQNLLKRIGNTKRKKILDIQKKIDKIKADETKSKLSQVKPKYRSTQTSNIKKSKPSPKLLPYSGKVKQGKKTINVKPIPLGTSKGRPKPVIKKPEFEGGKLKSEAKPKPKKPSPIIKKQNDDFFKEKRMPKKAEDFSQSQLKKNEYQEVYSNAECYGIQN